MKQFDFDKKITELDEKFKIVKSQTTSTLSRKLYYNALRKEAEIDKQIKALKFLKLASKVGITRNDIEETLFYTRQKDVDLSGVSFEPIVSAIKQIISVCPCKKTLEKLQYYYNNGNSANSIKIPIVEKYHL